MWNWTVKYEHNLLQLLLDIYSHNNGTSYQPHSLSVSVSVPCNVCALALKCQNIPQKLQVRNCFSQNKKRFRKKFAVSLSRTVYTIIVVHFYCKSMMDLWIIPKNVPKICVPQPDLDRCILCNRIFNSFYSFQSVLYYIEILSHRYILLVKF